MIRDSITILKGIPKLFVNRDKNKNTIFFMSPAEHSKPPSGGTITTDRCLTHIRDAAHSESMRYWIYYSTWLSRSFASNKNGQAEMICTGGVPTPKRHIGGADPSTYLQTDSYGRADSRRLKLMPQFLS